MSDPADLGSSAASEERNASGAGCPPPQLSEWHAAVLPAYILLIAALGVALNVFVMAVLLLHKKACTVAEIYLSNMAAADFLLTACLPFWAAYAANGFDWTLPAPLCSLVTLCIKMNADCSIYFLVLISIDRYVALVHPLSRSWIRRPAAARGGCVLVWGVGVALSAPTLLYRDVVYVPYSDTHKCFPDYPSAAALHLSEGTQVTFGFVVPVLIISVCTFRILRALRRRLDVSSRRAEHRATRLVLAVLVAFAACWLPFHAVKVLYLLVYADVLTGCSLRSALHTCSNIFMYLAFFNSVLNPILYVIVGNNFRKKVCELFRRPSGGRAALGTTFTCSNASRSFRTTGASR
ncbi:B2 bradykinin receptor [Liparis tanakae]|uniref:B2 bradykinin receptor n=1 Tax=Liparis tanakae TaxID=230148 RepID=A0A4Z2EXM9_9TELE|nr:B2 bradykinin receptor [Liparis tanakae]